MPLKERGGELLREFININYKLINSHYHFRILYDIISPKTVKKDVRQKTLYSEQKEKL